MKSIGVVALALTAVNAFALGGNPMVRFSPGRGAFPLIEKGGPAQVLVDAQDWPGVARAARDLQNDLARVSGWKGEVSPDAPKLLVGTIGHSPTIDRLINQGKLNVDAVRGQWEASVTQKVGDTLVVAGSDKRGTIYALYDLSESAGVSPWNWWADVPVKHRDAVYVAGRYVAKSPVVKYRGIFLNDEAPSLSNWVYANFGNYNHLFYEKVFELLLRLRANYLWPAMWNNCFSQDDPLNPAKADEYGIVMGTSHVEPMMRADKEWNRLGFTERQWNYATNPKELEQFWREGVVRNKPYENVVTIAMRGKVDTPMSETANIALLEQIVAAQRKVLAECVNPDVAQIPQLWCLYKEVQEYYEKGMRVPDDVTLLWSDDNWGDIRRLPTLEERKRSGGAGVYYHFDYVGGPRNYKWIDTNPIPKIWEQMNLAHRYGADRIWIVNVGDLKPMEFPMEFFLTMARDPDAIRKEDLQRYTERWVAREFGPAHAKEIAAIMSATKRINGRRKPELLSPETFSVLNYREAERVDQEIEALILRSTIVESKLPEEAQAAYFQLVRHPLQAAQAVNELYNEAARNRIEAAQGRHFAGMSALRGQSLIELDTDTTLAYHGLLGGKWNHMMDQVHLGYTGWQQPDKNVPPTFLSLELPPITRMGVTVEGSTEVWPKPDRSSPRLTFDRYGQTSWRIEPVKLGTAPFTVAVHADKPWIKIADAPETDHPVEISIDWAKRPPNDDKGQVAVTGAGTTQTVEILAVDRPRAKGFVEGDGFVAIEAEHASRRTAAQGFNWETIPGYGRTLSGVAPFPVEFKPFEPGKGPRLDYDLTTFTAGKATLQLDVSPSLGFQPGHGLRLAVAFDGETPQVIDVAPKYLSREWEQAVSDAVQRVRTTHNLGPGHHKLKLWAIDPGVVVERIVIDLGGLKPSYLGPPESRRLR